MRFVRQRVLEGDLTFEEARAMLHGRSPFEAWGAAENASEGHHKGLAAYTGPWPTPTASDSTRGPDFGRGGRAGSGTDDLTTKVAKESIEERWPTPRASPSSWYPESDETYNQRGRQGAEGLATEVARREGALWPTPTAEGGTGYMSGPKRDTWRPTLEGAAQMSPEGPPPKITADEFRGEGRGAAAKVWPTPTTSDRLGSRRSTARKEHWTSNPGTTLTDAAWATDERWRTPTSRDFKGASSQSWRNRDPKDGDPTPTLSDQVLVRGKGGLGRLNPDWVEWLMGWPVGWTSLEPLPEERWTQWLEEQGHQWGQEPEGIPRLQKGVPSQTDRLRATGNGWVALCGAVAFVALAETVRQVNEVLARQDEVVDLFDFLGR